MKFNNVKKELKEAGRLSTSRSGIASREAYTKPHDAADIPEVIFDVELYNVDGIIKVGAKARPSGNSPLNTKGFSAESPKEFVLKLVKIVRSEGFEVDVDEFKKFFVKLTEKAMHNRPGKLQAFSYPGMPTKSNKNKYPKWDAKFVLQRLGGRGNVLGFKDLSAVAGNQPIAWEGENEKETDERDVFTKVWQKFKNAVK